MYHYVINQLKTKDKITFNYIVIYYYLRIKIIDLVLLLSKYVKTQTESFESQDTAILRIESHRKLELQVVVVESQISRT